MLSEFLFDCLIVQLPLHPQRTDDCGDESDEKYCLNTNTVYADRTLLAKKNRHNLHSYNQTMKWQNLKVDLPTLGPNGCLVNEFKCNNGECIAAEKRCDLLVGGWPGSVRASSSISLTILNDSYPPPFQTAKTNQTKARSAPAVTTVTKTLLSSATTVTVFRSMPFATIIETVRASSTRMSRSRSANSDC